MLTLNCDTKYFFVLFDEILLLHSQRKKENLKAIQMLKLKKQYLSASGDISRSLSVLSLFLSSSAIYFAAILPLTALSRSVI